MNMRSIIFFCVVIVGGAEACGKFVFDQSEFPAAECCSFQKEYIQFCNSVFDFWGKNLHIDPRNREDIVAAILRSYKARPSRLNIALFFLIMGKVFDAHVADSRGNDFNYESLGERLSTDILCTFSEATKALSEQGDVEQKEKNKKWYQKKRYWVSLLLLMGITVTVTLYWKFLKGEKTNSEMPPLSDGEMLGSAEGECERSENGVPIVAAVQPEVGVQASPSVSVAQAEILPTEPAPSVNSSIPLSSQVPEMQPTSVAEPILATEPQVASEPSLEPEIGASAATGSDEPSVTPVPARKLTLKQFFKNLGPAARLVVQEEKERLNRIIEYLRPAGEAAGIAVNIANAAKLGSTFLGGTTAASAAVSSGASVFSMQGLNLPGAASTAATVGQSIFAHIPGAIPAMRL